MSTPEFLIGQMAGENGFDPMLFDPNHQRNLVRFPQQYLYDYDGSDQALAHPLSQLTGADKHDGGSFESQLGSTHADFYSFNNGYQYPPTALDQLYETVASLDSQMPPSGELSPKRIPNDAKKSSTKSKKRAPTKKQHPPPEKPVKDVPKPRRQSKPDATKSDNNQIKESKEHKEPKEPKVKHRRKGSLERNRVAASKCRKRKKQWTENLEEKKSGLEAVNSDLQTAYMDLLQESSQLKNLLIGHGRCQDPDIDVWINNEASKYVHNLHSPQEQKSLCSVLSLDGSGSTLRHSTSTSPCTGSQGSPGRESQDLNSNDFPDDDDLGDDEEF